MVAFADRLLDYVDSGAGPDPGPYGIDESGNGSVPVSPDIIVDENTTVGALSLPIGSSVTVGFSNALISDQPGNDLSVLELSAAGEQAEVYVSSDFDPASPRENFVLLGTAGVGTTSFDLASIEFEDTVEAVKVVGLDLNGRSPGFDVANVQALQPTSQITDNLIALQPEWDSEDSTLRYGFEVENANDFIAQNVEVELSFAERIPLGPGAEQSSTLGEIPVDQTNPEIIGNQIWYELPIEDIPLELSNEEINANQIVATVDPENLISEPDETDNTQGVDYFFVRTIPQIMRNLGEEWEVPASFQERWLNGEATRLVAPPDTPDFQANPDTQLLSLDWILRDDVDTNNRAQEAFDSLTDPGYLFSENGRNSLIDQLIPKLAAAPEGETISFGVEGTSAEALDSSQFQNSDVVTEPNSLADLIDLISAPTNVEVTPLDPLLGALGDFSFYAVPIGTARQVENENEVTIEATVTGVGIYALDLFEFNGRQFLGNWEPPDQVSRDPSADGTNVFNGTYRNYREQTGLGEDFTVVSNVEEITFSSSIPVIESFPI